MKMMDFLRKHWNFNIARKQNYEENCNIEN